MIRLDGDLSSIILTNWYIIEHLASTLGGSTIDFLFNHIVEEMVLEAMAAETLRAWSYCPAVLPFAVSERDIQPVLSGLPHIILEFLKLLLTHHLATICVTHNATWWC
jgi:hypothetical protein